MTLARILFFVVVLATVQGCTGLSAWRKPAIDNNARQLSLLDSHLQLMRDVTSGNYQEQLDLYDFVVRQRELDATTQHRLREALVLITSGHPNSDRGKGYSALTRLLDTANDLTELERHLAAVVLNETENAMILEAQNAELSTDLSNSQSVATRGSSDRRNLGQARRALEAAQQEIDALESELAEARAKLEAIKQIEVTSE
ncbi:MAG: hypothetical protein AAF465_06430 [Pseudomonadota bacterium]